MKRLNNKALSNEIAADELVGNDLLVDFTGSYI